MIDCTLSVSLRREEPAYGVCGLSVCVCVRVCGPPPPPCAAPAGVCLLFVLSTLVRGVLLSLSATTAVALAGTGGDCISRPPAKSVDSVQLVE